MAVAEVSCSSCFSIIQGFCLLTAGFIYKESKYLTELYYFAQERSVNLIEFCGSPLCWRVESVLQPRALMVCCFI